jgi:hypothetical protein
LTPTPNRGLVRPTPGPHANRVQVEAASLVWGERRRGSTPSARA